MQDFKKLSVWQDAMDFSVMVYNISKTFPHDEVYGITSQLRRAAYSIGANIAEGAGRLTTRNFRQFLVQANGSTKECENFLILCNKLKYLSDEEFKSLNEKLTSVAKQLYYFIKSLKV